jgi:hypothetical protein
MQGMEDLPTEESFQFAQVDGHLPKLWVLLDNQSTVSIFYNKALLWDIRVTTRRMRVQCNAEWMVTNLIGCLPGYPGEVWYNPAGITNIISLADAEKYFRVRFDSEREKAFVVKKFDGTEHRFVKTAHGLYCFDTATHNTTEHGMTLVTTVANNKSKYPVRTYRQALLVRKLQTMIRYPSRRDNFMKIVEQNLILPNCPIGHADILLAAEDILGPHVGSLKGEDGLLW